MMQDQLEPRALINSNRAAFWIPGFAVASWGPYIPYIKENFTLTENHLGILIMCMAIGALIAMLVGSPLLTKFGCKNVVRIAGVVVAFCLASVTVIPNVYLLGLVLLIFGLSCECLSLAANVNAGALERLLSRNIMSGLHGVYSLGNTVGVFIVASSLSAGLDFVGGHILFTSCVLSLIVILYCALYGSRNLLDDLNHLDNKDEKEGDKSDATAQISMTKAFFHPMLLLLGIVCFIMFLVEGSMMDWTGVFLNEIKGMKIEEAGYGFAAFAGMMTICRLLGDKIVSTLGRKLVLTAGAALAVIGVVTAVYAPNPLIAIIGFAIVGIGASNIVPQTMSYAATVREVPIQKSILVVNAIGYIGSLFGPAFIGFLAHHIGLSSTFLVLALGVVLVGFISLLRIKSGDISTLSHANS